VGALATTANAGSATVVLRAPATTSAGIFDQKGRLERSLWSAQRRDRGPVTITWDGRDDDGQIVASGERGDGFVARVLAHNVSYEWEGVIGNTSRDDVGPHVFRSFLPIHAMAFDGAGNGFYATGYNEGQPAMHRFTTADTHRQTALGHPDYRRVFRYVATDGQLAYFANAGLVAPRNSDFRDPETFVLAFDVAGGAEHSFTRGRPAGTRPTTTWHSVVDYDQDDADVDAQFRRAPTGLAVQRHGDALFVAHGGVGEIHILDKRSGVRLGVITAPGASAMDVAPDDSLWVLSRTVGRSIIIHYRRGADGWTKDTEFSGGLIDPVAIGVSPRNGLVAVVDAGSEQLKAFDEQGRLRWTLGREGGYRVGGPEVADDRFGFSMGPCYVAFQADGSFWLGDPANVRNLHYSAARVYLGQIMYLPRTWIMTVDVNDPRRVFRHFLEFEVDYSKPLERSWRLARNWFSGLDQRYRGDYEGLQSVYTLGNGRTYGVVRRYDINRNEMVELTRSGLRPVGATVDYGTKLYADGSLRSHLIRAGSLEIYARALTRFDPDGNPQWGKFVRLAGVTALRPRDPFYHDVPVVAGVNESTYPQTSSGVIVSFTPGKSDGFHLGGVAPDGNEWLWRASPSGSWTVERDGTLSPRDGRFDIDNGVQYPASVVLAQDRNIIFGYHGEAWNGGEANQWLHFYDNGLFIGQFGRAGVPGRLADRRHEPLAGSAGNAFSPQLVSVHGRLYLWHNDESAHGGVHRWRIRGADRLTLLEAPIAP
jgi:hypothetical protein